MENSKVKMPIFRASNSPAMLHTLAKVTLKRPRTVCKRVNCFRACPEGVCKRVNTFRKRSESDFKPLKLFPCMFGRCLQACKQSPDSYRKCLQAWKYSPDDYGRCLQARKLSPDSYGATSKRNLPLNRTTYSAHRGDFTVRNITNGPLNNKEQNILQIKGAIRTNGPIDNITTSTFK